MIVVSDTTPLNYLVLIGTVDFLPKLFEEIYIPLAVMRELSHAKSPQAVRNWILNPPSWLAVKKPDLIHEATTQLDPGEAEAISLAKELGIETLLIDERRGRQVAQQQALKTIRTIAVLESAAQLKLIDLRVALQRLRQTTYRVGIAQIEEAIERDAAFHNRDSAE